MSSSACELYTGHTEAWSLYAIQQLSASTASDLCTLLLLIVCVRTVFCQDGTKERETK